MSTLFRLAGAVEQDPSIDRWLEACPDPVGPVARTWFAVLRRCGPDVRELMHDGHATVCVQDAPFAYVGAFKAHVGVGFFRGAELPDPRGLLEGSGKRMRHVKVRPGHPVDVPSLEALVAEAYRDIVASLRAGE